jgi:hypothetical protein
MPASSANRFEPVANVRNLEEETNSQTRRLKMKLKCTTLIGIIVFLVTVTLYGDLRHAEAPRGKIEKIAGEGDFLWDKDDPATANFIKEGKEWGPDFSIRESRWEIRGGDQEWVFTLITRLGDDDKEPMIKRERFWVSLLKADGVWITRTKYRYREGKYREDEPGEVEEKDKGSKFSALCRITGTRIILAATKQKQGCIFRITKKDGALQVDQLTIHDLRDWTIRFKKL